MDPGPFQEIAVLLHGRAQRVHRGRETARLLAQRVPLRRREAEVVRRVRLDRGEHLARPAQVAEPGRRRKQPLGHATAAAGASRSGRFAVSLMRTLTSFDTPASCMVTPYSTSTDCIVRLMCVIRMNCEWLVMVLIASL